MDQDLNKELVEEVVEEKEVPQSEEPKFTETELKAAEEGWVPKDQWKGPEDEWVPAKAFLKYGQVESELKRTRSESTQKEKVIKTMKDYYLNVKEDAKKEIVDTLKRHKKEALKQENYEEVAKIDAQLDELTDNLDRKLKQHDEKLKLLDETPKGPPPEFYSWNKQNSWYVLGQTTGLTKEADTLAIAYAQQNPSSSYEDMLAYVGEAIKKLHPKSFEPSVRERPADINEPGEVQGESQSKKRVKLSASEKAAAEAFGMTHEEYASGLQKWDTTRERQ